MNMSLHKAGRLFREDATIISTLYCGLFIFAICLSLINVFQNPLPVKPDTSIGVLTVAVIGLLALLAGRLLWKKEAYGKISFTDIFVVYYVVAGALSAVAAREVSDTTPVRTIFLSGAIYFAARALPSLEKQLDRIVVSVGVWTVILASLSVLHMISPGIMNALAERYFGGLDAYGAVVDYERGRLLHWGSIILSFPFFYASVVGRLRKPNTSFPLASYAFFGFLLLVVSMVASNFRWTLAAFLAISFSQLWAYFRLGFVSRHLAVFIGVLSCLLLPVGLVLSELFLGYNVVSRILLTDHQRDVSQTVYRVNLYSQAVDVFVSSPVVGVGPGNYLSMLIPREMPRFFDITEQTTYDLSPIASHNEYLTILAETGIIGFFFIMWTLSRGLITAIRSSNNVQLRQPIRLFSLASAGTIVSFFLYSMFENTSPHAYVFLFAIIGIGEQVAGSGQQKKMAQP